MDKEILARAHNEFHADKQGTSARSQAEAKIEHLREGGGVFVQAVRASRMAMVVADPTLVGNPIVFANEAFLKLSGYTMEEVLGQQPHFMNGEGTNEADAARFREALEQDRDELVESVQYRKDGSRFVAAVFLSAFKDEQGRTLHQFLSYLDISRRVSAEARLVASHASETQSRENEELLRALAAASAEVLYRMSPDWGEMRQLSGGSFLAPTKNPSRAWLMDSIPSENQAEVRAAVDEAIRTGSNFELEHRVRRQDGSIGWTLARAVPILGPEGEIIEWAGAARDITERKQDEARLRAIQDRHAFLLMLSDVLRPIADPAVIQGEAARVIGQHLQSTGAYYVEVDEKAGEYVVPHFWHEAGQPQYTHRFPLSEWPMPWLMNGKTWVVRDTATDPALPDEQRDAYLRNGLGAQIVVPLIKESRLVATFLVNHGEPRDWKAGEIQLVEETAERTWAALERARAEAALRESEERYRAILESALDYAIFTTDAQGRIETWPPGAEAVFGWTAEQAIGRDMAITFVPEDRESGAPEHERAEARDKGCAPDVRWHLRRDGGRVFIEGSIRPLLGGGHEPHGYLKVGKDIAERREWQDRQNVLLAELQHRTRNLMSIVRSMFEKTRRGSATIEELTKTYSDRLEALARVQGLLSRLNEADRISFDELIRTELSAMGALDGQGRGERVVLDGPEGVRLRSSSVQTFALALHELATNATKYGALAQSGGRLSVRWCVLGPADEPRLRIEWVESGVDMSNPGGAPHGSGYGRELIERALPYQLQAATTYELGPEGVHCTIELPVSYSTLVEEYQDA
ncbi:MAG: PAS domain S-box protein [Novosphingobium sp.]